MGAGSTTDTPVPFVMLYCLSSFAGELRHILPVQPVCCDCHWRINDDVSNKLNPVNLAEMVAKVKQRSHSETMH